MREFIYDYLTSKGYHNPLSETYSKVKAPSHYQQGQSARQEVIPIGAAARGNFVLSEYLDGWVAAHKEKGTFQRIYDHWILGEGANRTGPRWSVIRNMLHWVE